jgi:putative membrane protein
VIRFLANSAVSIGAAAVGLVVAASVLDRMAINVLSVVAVALSFAVLAGVLGPFVTKVALQNAPAVHGGIGIVTTFIALVITDLVSDGLSISGVTTWVLATLIVWIATMIASLLLPLILARAGVEALRDDRRR